MTDNFDIIQYFEDNEIEYWTKGKNVHKGWVNVTCPFCGDHSYSGNNHCGIHLEAKTVNCWLCGPKGFVVNLIAELEECSFAQANTIIAKYPNDDIFFEKSYKDIEKGEKIDSRLCLDSILPKESTNQFPKMHLDYLKSRNFDPDIIIPKYKLKACHNIGSYKFRIIIPIIQNRKIVNFTSRDVTGESGIRYKACPEENAIAPMTQCLYNIDNVRGRSILVMEGATDVWRIGNGAVGILRTGFSNAQIELILRKNIDKAFVMFDSELQAIRRAKQLVGQLSVHINHVQMIELSSGDPGDSTEAEVNHLKKIIGI